VKPPDHGIEISRPTLTATDMFSLKLPHHISDLPITSFLPSARHVG